MVPGWMAIFWGMPGMPGDPTEPGAPARQREAVSGTGNCLTFPLWPYLLLLTLKPTLMAHSNTCARWHTVTHMPDGTQ